MYQYPILSNDVYSIIWVKNNSITSLAQPMSSSVHYRIIDMGIFTARELIDDQIYNTI